jgi:hypothetical protein
MEKKRMTNKTFLATICLLLFVGSFVGVVAVVKAAETGESNQFYPLSDDTRRIAHSTYWPDTDSSEAVVSLNPNWGPPTGLLTYTFYDDSTDGQALVAEAAGDRCYIDPDGYGADDLAAYQISLYRCELDGTTNAITTSVWTIEIWYWIDDADWCGEPQ